MKPATTATNTPADIRHEITPQELQEIAQAEGWEDDPEDDSEGEPSNFENEQLSRGYRG